MKKIISLIAIVLCLSVILCGCDILSNLFIFDKTNELVADLPTGDTLEFLITKDSGYKMTMNKSTRHYEVTNNDGEIILDFIFRSEKDLQSYVNQNNRYLSAYENGTTNSFVYSVCSHNQNEKGTFVLIGWCLGTNTGFVATTPVLDRNEINQFLDNCDFNIQSTNQQNTEYYANFVKIK